MLIQKAIQSDCSIRVWHNLANLFSTLFVLIVEVPGGALKNDLLNSKHVYIMDCHSELFVW